MMAAGSRKPGYSALEIEGTFLDMSLSTNPYGCSAAVARALADGRDLSRYPEPHGESLREELARVHGIQKRSVVLGAGADELIYTIIAALRRQGFRQMVTTEFVFPNILHAAREAGFALVQAPYAPGSYDEALRHAADLAKLTRSPLFVCNPSAPFGDAVRPSSLIEFVRDLPAPVIVDEAAVEFCPGFSMLGSTGQHAGVTVIRSFSKAYGLAGLRLGWASATADLVEEIATMRRPFVTSTLAHVAGVAALRDTRFVENSVATVLENKVDLARKLSASGVRVFPSKTSSFVIDVTEGAGASGGPECFLALGVKVVGVSDFHAFGRFNSMVRVATQLPEVNGRFAETFLSRQVFERAVS